MSSVIDRQLYTIKIARLDDGGVWLDLFATDGLFEGVCVISAEGDDMAAAMADLAERLES